MASGGFEVRSGNLRQLAGCGAQLGMEVWVPPTERQVDDIAVGVGGVPEGQGVE